MTKKINLLILTLVIFFTYTQTTYSATYNGYGDAATLKITIKKMEVCTGFEDPNADVDPNDLTAEMINSKINTDTFCNNPIVIGDEEKVIDIGSVEPGEVAGTYGTNLDNLRYGKRYSHMRLTIDRKFTIKNKLDENGKGIDTGGADLTSSCNTKTTTDLMYGSKWDNPPTTVWTEATTKYVNRTSVDETESGTPQEMNVYYVNGRMRGDSSAATMDHCYGDECDRSSGWNWTWTYTQSGSFVGSGKENAALAMSVPTEAATPGIGVDDVILIYAFEKTYRATHRPRTLDIRFGTQEGILVYEASKEEGSGWRDGGTPSTLANAGGDITKAGKCAFAVGFVNVKIRMRNANVEAIPLTGDWN